MKLLVIRFSAMGDVAMLAPVVHRLLEANPNLEITVLTKIPYDAFFHGHERLKVKVIAHQTKHKGLIGLWRLTRWISSQGFDYIIDVHDNLRSRIIASFSRLFSLKTIRFEKGRQDKKTLVKNGYQQGQSYLKHSTDRYLDAFSNLELVPGHQYRPIPKPQPTSKKIDRQIKALLNGQRFNIGLAPFAAHPSKVYPTEQLVEVARKILHKLDTQFIIFGGPNERTAMDNLQNQLANTTICVPSTLSLSDELYLIDQLDIMVAMDSANMHMAAILGKRVVSIWGATHPALGFGPLFNEDGIVQAALSCRPCSVFGRITNTQQAECAAKAFDAIFPDTIADRVIKLLEK